MNSELQENELIQKVVLEHKDILEQNGLSENDIKILTENELQLKITHDNLFFVKIGQIGKWTVGLLKTTGNVISKIILVTTLLNFTAEVFVPGSSIDNKELAKLVREGVKTGYELVSQKFKQNKYNGIVLSFPSFENFSEEEYIERIKYFTKQPDGIYETEVVALTSSGTTSIGIYDNLNLFKFDQS